MAEFYVTEERAFAPGIAGAWPKVIAKPDNPNGRLVKLDGAMLDPDQCRQVLEEYKANGYTSAGKMVVKLLQAACKNA